MRRLIPSRLIRALGGEYEYHVADDGFTAQILHNGQHVAYVNTCGQYIESRLCIKWTYLPTDEDWPSFEAMQDAMPLIDAELRGIWERAGFEVSDVVLPATYRPEHDPDREYPMGHVMMLYYPKTTQDAVAAIQFIEDGNREVWVSGTFFQNPGGLVQ